MPLLEELQTQLICLRRLGDQASDAATAALLHGTCVPQPIDLLGQLREFCSILQEEAAVYFAGGCSVGQAAEHIQSRASLYLQEQYP